MVSIIVPIYYCDPTLYLPISRCLTSLYELSMPFELITVDDASPLDHDFSCTIRHTKNEGYTRTVNDGLAGASGDVLVVMNDDIEMTAECFTRFSSLEGLAIASPADTASSPDDRFGACFGMTRETYELLGPLNSRLKNFYSDRDYYDRAKEAGVEIIKWSDIVLNHPESSTYKLLDKEMLLNADKERYTNN